MNKYTVPSARTVNCRHTDGLSTQRMTSRVILSPSRVLRKGLIVAFRIINEFRDGPAIVKARALSAVKPPGREAQSKCGNSAGGDCSCLVLMLLSITVIVLLIWQVLMRGETERHLQQ